MKTPTISGSTASISNIWTFVLLRTGLAGAGAVRILARLISFPFTFCTCYSMLQPFIPDELSDEVEI
jgi:hypothetical protein